MAEQPSTCCWLRRLPFGLATVMRCRAPARPHTGFSLDGVSFTNEQGGDMQTAYFMDNEDTQEFRVNSVNNPAEYKYSAMVEQTIRGGTNTFMGSQLRTQRQRPQRQVFFAASKAVTRNNQFYGAISGPVYIPKLYNGHNKTFFYFHYETMVSARRQQHLGECSH